MLGRGWSGGVWDTGSAGQVKSLPVICLHLQRFGDFPRCGHRGGEEAWVTVTNSCGMVSTPGVSQSARGGGTPPAQPRMLGLLVPLCGKASWWLSEQGLGRYTGCWGCPFAVMWGWSSRRVQIFMLTHHPPSPWSTEDISTNAISRIFHTHPCPSVTMSLPTTWSAVVGRGQDFQCASRTICTRIPARAC